jgi:hypothetical protein
MIVGCRYDPYVYGATHVALEDDGENEDCYADESQCRLPPGRDPRTAIGFRLGVLGKTVTDPIQIMVRALPISYQPMPLTINGPSRVATASGNLLQAAINIPSLGLSGFKSGMERPDAKRN